MRHLAAHEGVVPELRGVRSLVQRGPGDELPCSVSHHSSQFSLFYHGESSVRNHRAVRWRNWRGETPAANLTMSPEQP